MNVLILDDDASFRAVVHEILASRGHRVVQAASGKEASDIVGRTPLDLIVVDGLLPDTNGINWIAGLRASGNSARVVFVSAFWRDLQSFHRLTDELGVSLVVHKPVVPAALAEQLERQVDGTVAAEIVPPRSELDFREALAAMRANFAAGLPLKVRRMAQAVRRARSHPASSTLLADARAQAHKLRGTAGTYGFKEVSEAAGRIEDRLVKLSTEPALDTLRVWQEVDAAIGDASAAAAGAERAQRDRSAVAPTRVSLRAGRPRVLVVGEDPEFQRLAVEVGRQQLLDVVTAATAPGALEQARAAPPEAAVVDIPPGGGDASFRFARDLRSLAGCGAIPVAFVSVSGELEDRVAATHAGASLYLVKPLAPEALGASLRELVASRQSERPRVMILDDDPAFCARVAEVLGEDGMRVQVLEDPAAILDALETHRPDALLLDLLLPNLNGLEICRMLRTTPRWQELPILVVTAQTGVDARMAAFSAGADDYLPKPLVDDELRARVHVRVERSRLRRERLERDVLTGLLLRRAFLDGLLARMREAQRHRRPLTVCLIDLDRFKTINDTFGHLAGDRVLTALGGLLAARFRTEDLRGRWGGEEFVLAFPGEQAETIRMVVTRALDEFRSLTFCGDHGEQFQASFSAGVATYPDDGVTVEELVQVADRRLYAAKDAGRALVKIG